MWRTSWWAWVLVGTLSAPGCNDGTTGTEPPPRPTPHPLDETLRVNHLQAKGTHNSYHVETTDGDVIEWNYTHAPPAEQLAEQGVRKLELDVYYHDDIDAHRVYHVPIVDEGTNCDPLDDCLAGIKHWSDFHPGHHPLFIQIEPKDQDALEPEQVVQLMEHLEQEVLAVLPEDRIITPDEVRGDATSLAEAIDTGGWPTLAETRGRILFFLDCKRDLCLAYAHGGTSLEGRLIFAAAQDGDPFDAVRVINNPDSQGDAIRDAVMADRLVRTMVDNVPSALENDTRLEAGLDSGAHMLSSDVPVPRDDTEYVMEIPGGTPSRCNPISAPAECTPTDVEDPQLLAGE